MTDEALWDAMVAQGGSDWVEVEWFTPQGLVRAQTRLTFDAVPSGEEREHERHERPASGESLAPAE